MTDYLTIGLGFGPMITKYHPGTDYQVTSCFSNKFWCIFCQVLPLSIPNNFIFPPNLNICQILTRYRQLGAPILFPKIQVFSKYLANINQAQPRHPHSFSGNSGFQQIFAKYYQVQSIGRPYSFSGNSGFQQIFGKYQPGIDQETPPFFVRKFWFSTNICQI